MTYLVTNKQDGQTLLSVEIEADHPCEALEKAEFTNPDIIGPAKSWKVKELK